MTLSATHNLPAADAEPSEARIRRILIMGALILIAPLILYVYYRFRWAGLTQQDALEFAQMGRNLISGRGFSTYVLRPLLMAANSDPFRQPEVLHGPLYPVMLALAFGIRGAKDSTVAMVSGALFLMSLPVIFSLGKRLFGPVAAGLAVAALVFNPVMLDYALSGLHVPLLMLLFAALCTVIYDLHDRIRDGREVRNLLIGSGVLTGLLYLTDPVLLWIVPAVTWAVAWRPKGIALDRLMLFAGPLAIVCLPWMLRLGLTTGNPFFGGRGWEVLMYSSSYPADSLYRLSPAEVTGANGIVTILQKAFGNARTIVESVPAQSGGWLLAFVLPSLFFRLADAATARLRLMCIGVFALLFVASLGFSLELPRFLSVAPVLLVFALGFVGQMLGQAQLPRANSGFVIGVLALSVFFPFVSALVSTDPVSIVGESASAKKLANIAGPKDVVLTDQPWTVAWFTDRPALLIPETEEKVEQFIRDKQQVRWILLSSEARGLSPQWQSVYDLFHGWNALYLQQKATNQQLPDGIHLDPDELERNENTALLFALKGFAVVPPPDSASVWTVVAGLPPGGSSGGNGSETARR